MSKEWSRGIMTPADYQADIARLQAALENEQRKSNRWVKEWARERRNLRDALRHIHDSAAELGNEISAEWLLGVTAAVLDRDRE